MTPLNGWTGYVLEAVEPCGCVLAAIVDDEAITGPYAVRRFRRENATIRRVHSGEHRGIDVCPHMVAPAAQRRLFS